MTACSEKLQQVSYVAESTWAEASTDMTSAQIIPHSAMFDLGGLRRAMIESTRVVTYKDERPKNIPGAWTGASFVLEVEMTGHGSTTSGSTSAVAVENLIAWAMGGGASGGTATASASSGTTCSATGTAVALTTTASATFTAGYMFRTGAANDARGNGQWNNVASHATTTLTGMVAYDAAPINADVVYSAVNMYTASNTCAVASKRFRLLTADMQVVCHGCFPMSYTLTGYNPGEILKMAITVGVSWIEPVSGSFPDTSSTAAWTFNPTPVAGGSIVLTSYGATTRTILDCRSLNIAPTIATQPIVGYNGANGYQTVVGASRTPDQWAVTAIVGAAGSSATPTYYDLWAANTTMHMICSLRIGTGAAVGVYLRKLQWAGPQPLQTSHNGLNCVELNFVASSDPAGASEPTRAAVVMGFA